MDIEKSRKRDFPKDLLPKGMSIPIVKLGSIGIFLYNKNQKLCISNSRNFRKISLY